MEMSHPVFISYAHGASAGDAQALAAKLGELAFLDTDDIIDGARFPPRLLDGLLDARVVVIFATKTYSERRFCRLELRLALAGGDAAISRLVIALGEGAGAVLDAMPASVTSRSWPPSEETERIEELVRQRLASQSATRRQALTKTEAQKMAEAFLQESNVPEPRSLHGIACSLPQGLAGQSIGSRFVGRVSELRRIHQILSGDSGVSARLTTRITAGGGFGKTRLVIEYLHRYGRYYPGGLFWVNAASSSIDDEFWRVLSTLDATVPDVATMRERGRDIRRELERALRRIDQPALYVIDNIPEAAPGEDALPIGDFCPALGAVTVLATSRQDTREQGTQTISLDTLGRDAAILLLMENLPGPGRLSWADWGRVAHWVGDLPLALDLLNRSLALNSISMEDLLERVNLLVEPASTTVELEGLREALRGQVPRGAGYGITEAFRISFEKLDITTKRAAELLAQLAPAPIPEAFFEALPKELSSPAVRTALYSRHFVTSGSDLSFGVMHRLLADFLRCVPREPRSTLLGRVQRALRNFMTRRPALDESRSELLREACDVLCRLMIPDRCRDPQQWRLMNLFRPHAEVLLERVVAAKPVEARLTDVGLEAAILAFAQGDYTGARWLGERVLDVRKRVLGEEHPDTLTAMGNLAMTLSAQGDHASARRLEERALEARKRVLGEEHPDTLKSMSSLAVTLSELDDHIRARQLHEKVLEVRRRMKGEEHPDTLKSMSNLAETLRDQGDHDEARRLQEQVLEVRRRVLGEEHLDTLNSINNLAVTLGNQGDHDGERRLQEHVLEVRKRLQGEEHPDTLASMWNLGATLLILGENDAVLRLLRDCFAGRRRVLGASHPDTIATAELLRKFGDEPESVSE
jgi:tetratricopeptide (TPR) repeat protein